MKRFYLTAGVLSMALLLASCAAVTQPSQPTETAQPAVNSPTSQQTPSNIAGGVPSVTTMPTSGIFINAATLNGTVNPNNAQTQYWFEYGKTASHADATTALGTVAKDVDGLDYSAMKNVSASLTDLEPGTTYYFRLNAKNQFGTVNGDAERFMTQGTSTLTSSAGWKTYTNTDYSYSIKYPPTWTVDYLQARDNLGIDVATFLAPGMHNAPNDKTVGISFFPMTDMEKPDSAAYIKKNGNVIISKSPVVVGGVSTDIFVTNMHNGYDMEVYVEKRGSGTYELSLRNTTSSDKEYIDTFNLMLSSFEFTN